MPSNLQDLYDAPFVEEAYRIVLHREADPAGLQNYVVRLRSGEARSVVLSDLARSTEGRKFRENASFRQSALRTSLKMIPVLGTLIEALIFLAHIKNFQRDVRALENHIFRLSTLYGQISANQK